MVQVFPMDPLAAAWGTGWGSSMNDNLQPRFRFLATACPEAGFRVLRFEGTEELGRCYRFRIELASECQDLDLDALMGARACLTILRRERSGRPDLAFHGGLLEFCQLHQAGPFTFYEALLAPRLALLGLTRHNQVFLDQTPPEFLAACLRDGGLEEGEFRFALARDPATWERRDYLCQYGESHLDFVQRWLEREGLYYFFEQRDGGETVVFTDSRIVHRPRGGEAQVRYHPASGLSLGHEDEVVAGFACCRNLMPRTVVLESRNETTPDATIRGEAGVSDHGFGTVHSYGEHLRTPQEASRLAGIRAEAARCREARFEGRGSVPFLQPGHLFRLTGHYRPEWDGDYLILTLRHRGSQAGFPGAGPGRDPAEGEPEPGYENSFTALPAAVQFRLPAQAARPRIHGVLPATVDAEGDGVHLDQWSRYKLRLPFDQSGRGGGKASAWVRMLGPYAGAGFGWNSPLHKGTEVLLSFIDGDPDRPVIAGAVPNPRTPSPVHAGNPSQVVLQTSGGNRLAFEDAPGRESIQLACPAHGATFRLRDSGAGGAASLDAPGTWYPTVGSKTQTVIGNKSLWVAGLATAWHAIATSYYHRGAYLHASLGFGAEYEGPERFNYTASHKHWKVLSSRSPVPTRSCHLFAVG